MVVGILRGAAFDAASEWKSKRFQQLAVSVVKRDDWTCQCCGFKSKSYIRILHVSCLEGESLYQSSLQSNNSDFDPDKFKAACCICYESQRLGFSIGQNLGHLIYAPDFEQKHINSFFHLVNYVTHAISNGGAADINREFLNRAKVTNFKFLSLADALLERFAVETQAELVEYLKKMPESAYSRRGEFLSGVRYYPEVNAYGTRSQKWFKNEYALLNVSKWVERHRDFYPDLHDLWSNVERGEDYIEYLQRG